jgi:hypothetical protein
VQTVTLHEAGFGQGLVAHRVGTLELR